MSKLVKIGAALALSASVSFGATQADFDKVKAHVEAGVSFCKEVGVAKCTAEFNKKESKWVKGSLYIWANDFDGVITAHPKKPIAGKNLYRYKDKAGNQVFKSFIDQLKAGNEEFSEAAEQLKQCLQQIKSPEVDYFMDKFVVGYGLSLDKLMR